MSFESFLPLMFILVILFMLAVVGVIIVFFIRSEDKGEALRHSYFYIATGGSLLTVVIGFIILIYAVLNNFLFPTTGFDPYAQPVYDIYGRPSVGYFQEVENEAARNKLLAKFNEYQEKDSALQRNENLNRSLANGLAMIVVFAPIFIYHRRFLSDKKKVDSTGSTSPEGAPPGLTAS